MQKHNPLNSESTIAIRPSTPIKKGTSDLIVLKCMAQRVRLTLQQVEQNVPLSYPLLYNLQERHGRIHRIVFYQPQQLEQSTSLTFVGFISRKQKQLHQSLIDEVHNVDRKLIAELVNHPNILSYSSLELRTGIWCNLVLLSDNEAKTRFQSTTTHTHAAYQLAPRYYEWIRLHTGLLPRGLAYNDMRVQKTRYYQFEQSKPSIRELIY